MHVPAPEMAPLHDNPRFASLANGGDIVVHVNGTRTAYLENDPGRPKGHFALQVHSGNVMHLMFKDIEVRSDR